MNKIYLFFILFSFSAQAQNTVTNRVLPVVGDSFAYAIDTFIENTSMSPGGVNQTWDFTNVQSNGRRSEVYRDVNTSTGASDFPTANAYIRQGQREVFLKISSDKVEELGYNLKLGGPFPVGGTSAYPKPAVILKTPLNFLDASSYKTEAVITLPADFIPDSLLMGLKVDSIRIKTTTTVNVLVDGSGTLNLPAKSWNVLREKLTTSTKTTIEAKIFVWIDVTQLIGGQLGDFVQNTNTISYGFRSNDAKGYMALVAVDSTDKITQIQYKPNDLGVKTKDINDVNHQIQILTNPVNNILNLKTNEIKEGSYSLFLYNEAGQLVKSTIKELNSNQSIQFPLHELSEGIYNIIIVDPSKRIITNERFIKN